MEVGSFIELQFPKGKEFFTGDGVARLNSGRAAICHAVRILGCNVVYLPYYECEAVRRYLIMQGITVRYYRLDSTFSPVLFSPENNAAVVIVNYFGIMSKRRMEMIASRFHNVIIDNAQAFFAPPVADCLNVYSARKFVGVPDGAYVVGEHANQSLESYPRDYSSDTASFMLRRIEYGCDADTYQLRMENEKRLDEADIRTMSVLTRTILDGTDYDEIQDKRKKNFFTACKLFGSINKIDPLMQYRDDCVPMVYPLEIEDDQLMVKMHENKLYQGHWWRYLLKEVEEDSFEYWLSRYMIPITIDQRYGEKELCFARQLID